MARMIFDLPLEIQMAIKIRAVKSGCTTGDVVADAVTEWFAEDVAEAKRVLTDEKGGDVE
jgi:hypothetical protein